jgi:hypothetical protein
MVRWNQKAFVYARLGFYIVVPILLLVLPADFFDKGESICLSKALLDMECYACGITRATMHFIHFEFVDAYYFNPLSFVIVPLLILIWGWQLSADVRLCRQAN